MSTLSEYERLSRGEVRGVAGGHPSTDAHHAAGAHPATGAQHAAGAHRPAGARHAAAAHEAAYVPQAYRRRPVAEWRISTRRYLRVALLCAAFAAVYEHFSHDVWSAWMVALPAWPLVLGVIPALICGITRVRVGAMARQLWACGVMTLTMGSCLLGVLEIYGTTSSLLEPYIPTGFGLLVLGLLCQVAEGLRPRRA